MDHLTSINPYTLEEIKRYPLLSNQAVEGAIGKAWQRFQEIDQKAYPDRAEKLKKLARGLRDLAEEDAALLTREMGKILEEAEGELKKCAWLCDYYAEYGAQFLADRSVKTEALETWVRYEGLGPILAIMPWNFPFWQVFRFAAPALMAGNVVLLKHAPNVQGCALAIEKLFHQAGFGPGDFQNLCIAEEQTEQLIAHPKIRGLTLTGSVDAGRAVAEQSGKHLKPIVLELGGSNAFVVFEDADLEKAIALGLSARLQNSGQSCIAAKRFLIPDKYYERFRDALIEQLKTYQTGNPLDPKTDIGPLARVDLAEHLADQVARSQAAGAQLVYGGQRDGAMFQPTVLTEVQPGMPAFDEELFGPVIALIRYQDEAQALHYVNASSFGLGVSLITKDPDKARAWIPKIEDGAVFVNEMVKSDPRLPFGGTKQSGYGRELSQEGIRSFVNVKTVYLDHQL